MKRVTWRVCTSVDGDKFPRTFVRRVLYETVGVFRIRRNAFELNFSPDADRPGTVHQNFTSNMIFQRPARGVEYGWLASIFVIVRLLGNESDQIRPDFVFMQLLTLSFGNSAILGSFGRSSIASRRKRGSVAFRPRLLAGLVLSIFL